MNGVFQQIAFIILPNGIGVPLYIKTKNTALIGKQNIHRVAEIVNKHYKDDISNFIAKQKENEPP
jgi:hypothetical protein